MRYVKQLSEFRKSDLPLAGGKGANLGELIQAGLPVPLGFCVTTLAYQYFVEANQLQPKIMALVADLHPDQPEDLERVSTEVRALFTDGQMPEAIAEEIRAAYQQVSTASGPVRPPSAVAVRPSATAEDLPDLSFAGQQDTYLNIVGESELLQSVIRCWASLWTARALGYRARSSIAPDAIALAVVVQQMVPSEVSGVLFTANPLTGKRSETVIDAALGLGEALVSGMVEPDHYVVDSLTGQILRKTLGAKALSIRGKQGGGTETITESAASQQALPDEQIRELALLGQRSADFFGAPQDMEWAWANGRLYVLQSRAITSLYPLPHGVQSNPFEVFFAFSSWQGMLDPISAIGQDAFTSLVVGFADNFGSETTVQEQRVFLPAGDRLFVNITDLVRWPVGRTIANVFISSIDPVSAEVLAELFKDPRLSLINEPMRFSTRLRIIRGVAPTILRMLYNLLRPVAGRQSLLRKIDVLIADLESRLAQAKDLPELISIAQAFPLTAPLNLMPLLLSGIMAGQAPLQILFRLAANLPDGPRLVMELTRGLPHNVTSEMDLKLWRLARAIQSDPAAMKHFQAKSAAELTADYQAGGLPLVAQQGIAGFLKVYGFRGVAEIDIYRQRWQDNPLHIFQVLKSYLEITDEAASPEAIFNQGAERACQAIEDLAAVVARTRFGWFKARLVRFLNHRFRELGGLREMPKFTIVRILGILREVVRQAGSHLAKQGVIEQRDDIFFLHIWELNQLVTEGKVTDSGQVMDVKNCITQRKQSYQREMGRKRLPRILLSDGTTYYERAGQVSAAGEDVLVGNPVSAGVVEGIVRVVLDPHATRLSPGEILVCPATDPAWTPLFLAAAGLVMEVGGMMTHGSVVAREYGIPAVVGVSQATARLKTGQHIRVDGSSGQILVLDHVSLAEA